MQKRKQGLQKLTETDKKIKAFLAKKKILKGEATNIFTKKELDILEEILTKKLNESKGVELDRLLIQIDELLPADTKNQIWENNHSTITSSMKNHIEEYGTMPNKNKIAADTGLSRQTIHKHLNGFAEHPLYAEQLKQFKFMADRVLAKVIKAASLGDIKAARLYFDIMGSMNGPTLTNTLIKTQNNYIQINGTVLSQETIQQLTPEQLNRIEEVLKGVVNILPKGN